MKNILGIKKENNYYKIHVFDKKFKIFRFFKVLKNINHIKESLDLNVLRINSVSRGNIFFWENEEKMSYKEKVWYISQRFYERLGYFPDLVNPKTFNEKLNWMKLHYNNPLETRCIDKYEFKDYIKEKLGEGYTAPLLGVWDSVDDIDFEKLPERFFIKTNNGGGSYHQGVYFVEEKSKTNLEEVKYLLNDWLQEWQNVYYSTLASGYKDIKPMIIAEEDIGMWFNKGAWQYEIFCFHGEIKYILLKKHSPKRIYPKRFVVDKDFNNLNIRFANYKNDILNEKPTRFDDAVKIAEKLSKDFPFVRIDINVTNKGLYIGELTFTPAGGYNTYSPVDWDMKIGEWLDLSKLNKDYIID